MNVIFDISNLVTSQGRPGNMRGIYRVVLNTFEALCRNPGATVTASCVENSFLGGRYMEHESIAGFEGGGRFVGRLSAAVSDLHQRNVRDVGTNRTLQRRISRSLTLKLQETAAAFASKAGSFPLDRFDIFHQPAPAPIPPFVSAHRGKRFARFMTIYDFIPLENGDTGSPEYRSLRAALATLRPDDHAICISHYVKDQACERLGMDPAHLSVAPLAASRELFRPAGSESEISAARSTLNLGEEPYFLSLCALERRKNLGALLEAFSTLCKSQPGMDANLVLVGTAPAAEISALQAKAGQLGISGRLRLTGFVEDELLPALYSGALAFVFPSLAEGFGLPPLEAMQCGTPVISSDRTSLPEVVGDAGILIDPADPDALPAAMWRLYSRPDERQAFSKKGLERANGFTWEKCAQDHLISYRRALA